MSVISILLTIAGLCVFETISSIDNAIINAEVLSTVSPRARRFFLGFGLLTAVVVVRGVLPWLVVWAVLPQLGFLGAFTASFSGDPLVHSAMLTAAPVLLVGGGTFLILLFLHWLFVEPKNFGLHAERFFAGRSVWFSAAALFIVAAITLLSSTRDFRMVWSTVIGLLVFAVSHGLKENAESGEEMLLKRHYSDLRKLLYLEIIDATFSVDGVLGAFAFTLSIPLILLGNGLGALVVRQLTMGNISRVRKYFYLKNGAMYSIFFLGLIMVSEAFGMEFPAWISPVVTFLIVGFFFWKSARELKMRAGDLVEAVGKK